MQVVTSSRVSPRGSRRRARELVSRAARLAVTSAALAALSLGLDGSRAMAATIAWDADTGTAGAQDGAGAGSWTVGGVTFWDGTSSTNVATTNNITTDIAQFGSGGTLAAPATVNVSTQSINGLIFGATTTSGYTLNAAAAGQVLTIGSSGIVLNSGAQATTLSTGNLGITLGAAQSWTNNSTSLFTVGGAVANGGFLLTSGGTGNTAISSIISGTGGLTKSGAGTLTLSGANTFSGVTTVSAGIVRATTSAAALGAGTLTLSGGELQLANDTALSFGRNTTVSGATTISSDRITSGAGLTHTLGTLSIGAQTLTVTRGANATSGTGGVTFGNATLTGAANFSPQANALLTFSGTTGLGANLFTKSGAGGMTLTGVVSGTTAAGTTAINILNGVLTASSAANTFTGNIAVSGTGVFAMAGGTFTTAAPYGTSGTANVYKQLLLTNGGTFRLTSGTFNNNGTATNAAAGIIFNIGTGGGTLDVASGATLIIDDGSGAGTGGGNAQLQGSGTLTKTGLGILQQDDSAVFAGAMIIAAGTFQPASANAGGATTAGTTIQSGAQYNVNGITMTNAEPLTINGTGLAATPAGALTNTNATAATWVGPVTLGSASTIGGGAGALTLSSAATVNIGANVLTLNQGAGRTQTNGVISGTGSVQVTGTGLAGDWANAAAHTYSGGTTLNAGSQTVVGVSSVGVGGSVTSGAFGTGTVILNGGSLRGGTGGFFTVGNNVTLQANTTFYTIGSERSLAFAGPVTITGATRTLTSTVGTTVAGTTIDFQGAIGDGGNALGIVKAGAGNMTFSGANTYTGGTTVNGGVLLVTGSLANNTSLSVVPTIATGATLSFINNAANTPANISALTLGAATGTTTLGLDLGTASDVLATSAASTVANNIVFNLNATTGFGAGTYNLITAASGLTAGGATYSLGTLPGGFTYTLTPTDTAVQLNVIAATAGNRYWRGNLNNSWATISGANTNWATDAAGTVVSATTPGAGDTVIFSATSATGPAIATTLDNNVAIANLQFASAPTGVSSVAINPGFNPGTSAAGTITITPASPSGGIAVAQGAGAVTIAAPITLGAAQTWSVDSSTPGAGTASSLTVSGAISGAAGSGLTFTSTAGTTPIILSAAGSTYSGPSTISASTVVQGGATNGFSPNTSWTVNGTLNTGAFNQNTGSLVGGAGIVQNGSATNATLTIGSDNAASATFSGTIQNGSTGTLGITKAGTGLQILNGTNTYTGTTTVTGGTLLLGSALTATPVAVSGGTLQVVGNLPATATVTLSGTGSLDLFGASQTIASLASVAGNTITNSSSSTAASTTSLIGTPAGAGIYVDALTITGAGPGLASLITDGATRKTQIVTNNANSGTGLMGFTNGALNTFSGGLVLANNATGTRLNINAALTGTPFGTGPIIVGQTATDRAGIYFNTAGNTISLPLIINTGLGTDRFGIRNDGQTITLSGLITANADAVFSSNSATASNTIVTNKITGAGGLVLDLSQTSVASTLHTVTLNTPANANDYAGDTVVGRTNATPAQNYAATLALGAADQIPNGSGKGNVILNNNNATRTGTLNLNGFNETINGLSGNGAVDGISGTPTLTIGDNNATATFSGIIRNTAGTLTLTKIGSGAQTLSGASTFTGPINVNGGSIAFASSPATAGPLGNSTAITLNAGGLNYTAAGTNALNRTVAIGAGTGTFDVSNVSGVLTVGTVTSTGGNLIKTGPGALQITSSTTLNSGAAGIVVSGGTLQGGFGTGGIGSINVATGSTLSFQNTTAEVLTLGGTGSLTLASGSALTFELGASGTNDAILYNTASATGSITLNFLNVGGLGAGTYNLLNLNTGTANQLSGVTFTLGSAPVGFNYTINNDGTLVSLTTTASSLIYWNNTQGDGSWANITGNLGSIGAGAGTNFTSDALGTVDAAHAPLPTETVVFNTSTVVGPTITTTLDGSRTIDSLQFNGSGTPAVTSVTIAQGSGGTLTLKPASASGGIAILAGGGNATISAPLALDNTLASTQTWSVSDAGSTLNVSGNVAFGANVNKTGAGTLTLSGANSGSGNLNLNAGTLNLNSSGALGTGALNIANGTTLNNTSGSAVTLTGNGPTNINGDFTFTGANNLTLGTGAVTLANNPVITTTANTLTLSGNIGGTSNLTKAGAGILALSGTSSYTGITTITAGTLSVSNIQNGGVNSNLGASSSAATNLVFNGGTLLYTGGTQVSDRGFTINPGTTAIIDVAGGGNLTLAGTTGAVTNGVLTKNGTGTLTLAGASTHTGNTVVNAGTLNITGSLTGLTASTALRYGDTAGKTVVNVSGSFNGFITTGANVAGSVAVLNQTGGTITIVPTNGQDQQYLANNGGYGMLNITGGTFNTGRFDGTGATNGNGSTAVIYVGGTGATLNQNVGDWFLPIRNSGLMSMSIAPGGSFIRSAATTAQFSITGLSMSATNNVSYGILNVAGGTVDTGIRGINFSQGTFASGAFTSTGFVNVAGGTYLQGLNTGVGAAAGTTNAYFNYAGGTVRATAAMTAFIPANTANYIFTSTIFGPITNNDNANTAFNTQVGTSSNFTGGAIFDTNGFAVTYPNVIADGTGKFGVTQANITIPAAGNSGYVGAPMVQFAAPAAPGGVPATGYALLSGDQVSGIVITNPGTYATGETPLITLTGGGGTIAAFNTSAITTPHTAAGITKQGLGTLTLSSANTFTGPVNIQGGVLSVTTLANGGVASGLGASSNAASNVLLNGGVLDYSGTVAAVTDRNYTFAASNGGFGASGTTAGTFSVNTSSIVIAPGLGAANFVLSGTGTGTTGGGTLNGALADGTGTNISLVKTGTGSWTLAGATSNTYTGLTTVTGSAATAGALILAKTGGAIAVPGNLTIGNGTATQSHVLLAENEQISPTATVTLNGVNSGWSYIQMQGKTQTIGNIVETTPGYGVIETREGAGTFGASNVIFNVASGTQTYQGYFRDISSGLDAANSLKMTKTGAGTLQWGAAAGAGAAGTSTTARYYTGGTDIQNGTLQLLPANTAGSAISTVGVGNVSLNGGATFAGTLDLNGQNAGITGLDGTTGAVLGRVLNNASGTISILSVGNNGNNGTFAGLIINNTSGTGTVGINKVGAGTQVLSGANTYTGTTTLTAGNLNVGSAETPGTAGPLGNQLANAVGSIVFNGGTLQYSAANQFDYSGRFSTAANQGYRADTNGQNVTWASNLSSVGGLLAKSGAGTLTLTGTNTYTGTTTVTAGTLVISGATNTGAGIITVGSGTVATLTVATGGSLTTTGNLNLGSGIIGNAFAVQTGASVSVVNINNPWGTSYAIDGTLTASGTWTVSTNRTTDTFAGTGTINAAALTLGNATTGVNYTGTGTVNVTGAVTIATNAGAGTPFYTQTSGTLNAGSILLGDAIANTTGSRTLNLAGGRINVGSGGIASTGATTAPRTINLGAGTLGASANWSSSMAMVLTAATTPTINTLDAVDNTTGRTITLSGVLSGGGSLNKTGAGTLILSAANTYTGTTTVAGGILQVMNVTGSATGPGNVSVNAGGRLAGNGSIAGAVNVAGSGVLAPGTSPGKLTIASGTMAAGSTLQVELGRNSLLVAPVAGTDYDQLVLSSGTLAIDSSTVLSVIDLANTQLGDQFVIVANAGTSPTMTNTFVDGNNSLNPLFEGSPVVGSAGYIYTISYLGGDGNDVVLTTVVPEPASVGLAGVAVAGLLARRRRRAR